jgi:fatty acid desaturase
MIGTLVVAGCAQKKFPGYFWLSIPLCAISTGYWFSFIHLYIHEAAHYNIARNRKTNDMLANLFLGLIAGMHIQFYRLIHFDHHRYLGTTKDTENTYFEPLNWRFIIESLTGIRVFRVIAARNKVVSNIEGLSPEIMKQNKQMFLTGALFNFLLVCTLFILGYWQVAIVWMGGIGVIFPFFLSLRQLLEHRGDDAHADVNYAEVAHGETSRMFGNGLIAVTFGSAGFNRHLLHHWDPQVSCTRLKDVERFLGDTELAPAVKQNHTNYIKTFFKLFNK